MSCANGRRPAVAADRADLTAFRGILTLQPARRLNMVGSAPEGLSEGVE
jgi:hypothetical protein